jgi:hypothetical protein
LWVRLLANSSYPIAIVQPPPSNKDVLWLGTDLDLKPKYWPDNGSVVAASAITIGRWCMITCTAGCFTDRNTVGSSIYLNGQLSANTANTYATTSVNSPIFGGRSGFYSNVEFGSIEYYFNTGNSNSALSASRISAMYEEGRGNFPNRLRRYTPKVWTFGGGAVSPPPPVTWFPMTSTPQDAPKTILLPY